MLIFFVDFSLNCNFLFVCSCTIATFSKTDFSCPFSAANLALAAPFQDVRAAIS